MMVKVTLTEKDERILALCRQICTNVNRKASLTRHERKASAKDRIIRQTGARQVTLIHNLDGTIAQGKTTMPDGRVCYWTQALPSHDTVRVPSD